MTALLFRDFGKDVLTNSWTVAENDDGTVRLLYALGHDRKMLLLPISMPVLGSRIIESPIICDLRYLT
jgi:hypothetical protein